MGALSSLKNTKLGCFLRGETPELRHLRKEKEAAIASRKKAEQELMERSQEWSADLLKSVRELMDSKKAVEELNKALKVQARISGEHDTDDPGD